MKTRNSNKYEIKFAKSERYKKSPVINLQRMLNKHEQDRNWMINIET